MGERGGEGARKEEREVKREGGRGKRMRMSRSGSKERGRGGGKV